MNKLGAAKVLYSQLNNIFEERISIKLWQGYEKYEKCLKD